MDESQEFEPQEQGGGHTELVEDAVSILESVFTYFETLSIYWQKLLNQKLNHLAILLVFSLIFIFIICSGLSLLFFAGYKYLLTIFQGNEIWAASSLGTGLLVIATFAIYLLIRKAEV